MGRGRTLDEREIYYPLRPLEKERGVIRFEMRIRTMKGTFYCYHCSWLIGLGSTVALAKTDDFVRFTPIGSCTTPTNRNALLFPEKIGGRSGRFERPEGQAQIMWVSYSPDLLYWGDSRPISIPETSWSFLKNGAGICESPAAMICREWLFSFSRYDYTRGSEQQCLSSISPHAQVNFHRQVEWGRLTFEGGAR